MKMTKRHTGKKRSLSQRIGETGEALFKLWAIKNRLIPNKTESDYGIDFWCQRTTSAGFDGLSSVIPVSLGVQVKSFAGKNRKRVSIDRDDAEFFLSAHHPFCICAVDLDTEKVHLRYRDHELVDELISLLSGSSQSRSWGTNRFVDGNEEIARILDQELRIGKHHRLMRYIVEKRIANEIPGTDLELSSSSSKGTQAFVQTPWFGSAFQVSEDKKEQLEHLIFDKGMPIHPLIDGIETNPALTDFFEMADYQVVLAGGGDMATKLVVQNETGDATLDVVLRKLEKNRAYVHPIGVRVMVSDRTWINDEWVHILAVHIFKNEGHTFESEVEALQFFRNFRKGNLFNEIGSQLMPVETFQNGDRLGPAIDVMLQVSDKLEVPHCELYLDHLHDEEFSVSLSFLDNLLCKNIPFEKLFADFIWAEAKPDNGMPPKRSVQLEIPVALNYINHAVFIWITAECNFFIHKASGSICGLGIRKTEGIRIEIENEPVTKSTIHPELWMYKEWPGIPIGLSARMYADLKHEQYVTKEISILNDN